MTTACTTLPSDHRSETLLEARLDGLVPQLLAEEKAAGVGIAVIREGRMVWQGYYGEQAPGTPVSARTAFNTASIAKTITAETLIALHDTGAIDLEEPIASYVTHEDLAKDSRYQLLTARMLMSHRSGLLNWAYEYDDGKLAFDHDPDTRFSYSGAGVELAARYAEAKTGLSYPELARQYVFAPLAIDDVSIGRIPESDDGRLAMPMDDKGVFRPVTELNPNLARPEGGDGAADDLIVTVPAYAKLLVALSNGWGAETARNARKDILTSLASDKIYDCPELSTLRCPDAYGHSIGWQVFRYADHDIITHSGSDRGENALIYYSPDTRDGAVIFVNGANGWYLMTRIVEAIGDEPLLADYYRGLITTVMGRAMEPL